jgi:periplasmic protein TonB
MANTNNQPNKNSALSWGLIAFMAIMTGAAGWIVYGVLSDDSPRKKTSIATVTLLKPPPPPQIKEKLPEPPPQQEMKKEEIIDPGPQDDQTPNNDPQDNTPAGDKLGLDAEGGAGGDAFGLVGKKGGRSILAGGGGGLGKLSLLSKYSGYTQIIQVEIRKKVMKHLEEDGGIPKGKLQAVARVSVDSNGNITDCKIIGSSGSHSMDDTIKSALSSFRVSEPPPDGMPQAMDIKFTYQS